MGGFLLVHLLKPTGGPPFCKTSGIDAHFEGVPKLEPVHQLRN